MLLQNGNLKEALLQLKSGKHVRTDAQGRLDVGGAADAQALLDAGGWVSLDNLSPPPSSIPSAQDLGEARAAAMRAEEEQLAPTPKPKKPRKPKKNEG